MNEKIAKWIKEKRSFDGWWGFGRTSIFQIKRCRSRRFFFSSFFVVIIVALVVVIFLF